MKDSKIKHLELVQSVITRMNTNSFQIKSMAITIVSTLIAIYASEKNPDFILISIFPLLLFWFLDSYYLMQERRFRGLYNDILNKKNKKLKLFEMRPDLYKGGNYSFWAVFFSKMIWTVYLVTLIVLLSVYFYLEN